MRIALLVAWSTIALAVFVVTLVLGLSDTDRDARVPMPGKQVVALEPGDYGIWYEEPHATSDNEIFEAPDGVKVDVVAVENEPDPVVDLGGIGSQVGTGSRTAETIGKVTIAAAGSYRLVAGSPPAGAADITLGPTGSEGFVLGLKRAGWVTVAFALLFLLFEIRRRTRPEPSPITPGFQSTALVGAPSSPAFAPAPGTPARATVVSATPIATFPQVGEPSYTITMQVDGGPPVASGHRVPLGQEARLVPGAGLPVRIEPVSGKVLGIDWHLT